jgi:serine O-acetyltransferase
MGFWAVANHRIGGAVSRSSSRVVRVVGSRGYGLVLLLIDLTTGVQLNRETQIGDGLHLVHGWNIKIHPDVVIGAGVTVLHDVTIGSSGEGGVPRIGDGVFIACGARILGDVTVGRGARIGANSLVLSDVPPFTTAVGVPARILRYTGDERTAPATTPLTSASTS